MSMFVRRGHVEKVSGTLTAFDKLADSGRTIRMMACAGCGTRVWNEPTASPDFLVIKSGTLDEMDWAVPVGNIWTDSAPAWIEIDDRLVNFPAQPPTRQPLFDAWDRAVAAS
jgi:hypothetical protein